MIKRICDACGEEGGNNRVFIPCHLWSKSDSLGYADNDGNRVSGRYDEIDLCNKCNNRVYSAAVNELKRIKGEEEDATLD